MAEIRRLGSGANAEPEAATKAFAAYLRQRKQKRFSDRLEFNPKVAENALAGRIGKHTFPEGKIDWSLDTAELTRTSVWSDFAGGYEKGQAGYAQAFAKQFRAWRKQLTIPETRVSSGTFSTLSVGIRLGRSWTDAFQTFSAAPQVPDAVLIDFCCALVEQARYLERFHSDSTNWLVNEMLGLYSVGVLLPELTPAKSWRTQAIQWLSDAMGKEILADGAWSELAPGYGNWNSNNVMRLLDRAQDGGFASELPPDFTNRIDRTYAWMLLLMAPDGRVPRLNDSAGWLKLGDDAGYLARKFPKNPLFAWAAAGRPASGAPPASAWFKDSGFITMRSGWGKDATYVLFDVGPMGSSWHGHQDKLQVLLFAGNRELLMDNGGGSYPEVPQRQNARSSDSHNTVLVDGGGQARVRNRVKDESILSVNLVPGDPETPAPTFHSTPAWDYASAWYIDGFAPSGRGDGRADAPRPARHRREVALIKPEVVVVIDTLTATDQQPHTYEARWHSPVTQRELDATSRSVLTTAAAGPNLAIIPLIQDGLTVHHDAGVLKPLVLGWTFENDAWRPALTVRQQRKGPGEQRLVTLLKILKPGEKTAAITVTAPANGGYQASFQDGATFVITPYPAGGFSFRRSGGGGPGQKFDLQPPGEKKKVVLAAGR